MRQSSIWRGVFSIIFLPEILQVIISIVRTLFKLELKRDTDVFSDNVQIKLRDCKATYFFVCCSVSLTRWSLVGIYHRYFWHNCWCVRHITCLAHYSTNSRDLLRLQSVMTSRLVLNLSSYANLENHQYNSQDAFEQSRFASNSFLGNVGAPLSSSSMGTLDDHAYVDEHDYFSEWTYCNTPTGR